MGRSPNLTDISATDVDRSSSGAFLVLKSIMQSQVISVVASTSGDALNSVIVRGFSCP
jgi:hypothetical protein